MRISLSLTSTAISSYSSLNSFPGLFNDCASRIKTWEEWILLEGYLWAKWERARLIIKEALLQQVWSGQELQAQGRYNFSHLELISASKSSQQWLKFHKFLSWGLDSRPATHNLACKDLFLTSSVASFFHNQSQWEISWKNRGHWRWYKHIFVRFLAVICLAISPF